MHHLWFYKRCIPQWTNIFSQIFHSCHHPSIFRQWAHLQGPHLKQIFIEIVYKSVVNHYDRDSTEYWFPTYSLFYKQHIRQWSFQRNLVSHSLWNRHHILVSWNVYHIPRVNLLWFCRPCNLHQKDIWHLECYMGSLHRFQLILWSFKKTNSKLVWTSLYLKIIKTGIVS